jgi:uncharacterized protein (DUF4415 family)
MGSMYRFANFLVKGKVSKMAQQINRAIEKEQKDAIKQIYETERKEYADQARELFKSLCHEGKIKKEQQQALRKLLEDCLGSFKQEYKGWRFDNEFHRLYTYLRSYHLDEGDWHRIHDFLEQIQKGS